MEDICGAKAMSTECVLWPCRGYTTINRGYAMTGDRCKTLTCDVSLDLDSRSALDQPGRDGGDSAVPCNRSGTGITTIKPTRQTFNVASAYQYHHRTLVMHPIGGNSC